MNAGDFDTFYLPNDFLFGVANSAFQTEGGINGEGQPQNNFATWERSGKIEPSGDSVRFWEKPEEHIELAKSLGLNAFRMGIEWARIQPTFVDRIGPPPEWDMRAVDRYADIVEMIMKAGMAPIVTLHHFTHPAWLGRDPWLQELMPGVFVEYASRMVQELNERLIARGANPVKFWITMNEPNLLPLNVYITKELPTDRGGFACARQAWDNLLCAHVYLYDRIHDLYKDKGWPMPEVSYNTFCMSVYDFDKIFYDLMRAPDLGVPENGLKDFIKARRRAWNDRFLKLAEYRWGAKSQQTAYYRRYRYICSMLFNQLNLKKTISAIYHSPRKRKIDFIALDVYDPFVAGAFYVDLSSVWKRKINEPLFRPPWWKWRHDREHFRAMIEAHHENNSGFPIYILENCIANQQEKTGPAKPRPDGQRREQYIKWSIGEVVDCIRTGIPIKGYVYWTLVDNYEWGSFETRLGLYDYDHKAGKIGETSGLGERAGEAYARIVAALKSGDAETIRKVLQD